jgi:hypothetical protein
MAGACFFVEDIAPMYLALATMEEVVCHGGTFMVKE